MVVLGVAFLWVTRKGYDDMIRISKNEDIQVVMVGVTAEHYSAADVFVNPTYSDNFPTTNLEALACGTPVITCRTGGSPEAVDELTGAVVEQGNLEAMCNKIMEFKNTGFKQIHSSACRKRAEEYFEKDKCFEKYLELYERVLILSPLVGI